MRKRWRFDVVLLPIDIRGCFSSSIHRHLTEPLYSFISQEIAFSSYEQVVSY